MTARTPMPAFDALTEPEKAALAAQVITILATDVEWGPGTLMKISVACAARGIDFADTSDA